MDQADVARAKILKYQQMYQFYLDKTVPLVAYRWASTAGLLVLFLLRIIIGQGWYIICYGLGIYLLSLLLAFLSPKFDPSLGLDLDDEMEETEEQLPVNNSDEFKPFIRRLPEFKFWHKATVAIAVSILLSLFSFTDVPVFWPILVFYFVILFVLTMRRQIQHMIKYKYIPFDFGKKSFRS